MVMKKKKACCNLYMAWIYNVLPGMFISYIAEGTVAQFFIGIDAFEQKAKLTKSGTDDDFVNTLKISYGNMFIDHRPHWFKYTWDYGGHSLLGRYRNSPKDITDDG